MQTITPFLWFNDNATDAVNFYTSLFKDSKIEQVTHYEEASAKVSGRPEGSVMTVAFQLAGQSFIALNGGPDFTFSPAISLFVNCETPEEVDQLWQKLTPGGTVLMELGQYPFGEKYGWVQDQFGLSWQLMLGKRAQKITPCLLFTGQQHGKAEAAMQLYTGVFPHSKTLYLERYGAGEANPEGTVKHATFSLNGQEFIAMESAMEHPFQFTLAISFMVTCDTQEEINRYWDALSKGGNEQAQQCGWLQDQYGVSWQIVPSVLNALLQDPDPVKAHRAMNSMLQMKKLDIDTLQRAHAGKEAVRQPT